jgi:hypothetical protein
MLLAGLATGSSVVSRKSTEISHAAGRFTATLERKISELS